MRYLGDKELCTPQDRTCRAHLTAMQGMLNNQQLVAPTATFTWPGSRGARQVFVTGAFSGWSVRRYLPWLLTGAYLFALCAATDALAQRRS